MIVNHALIALKGLATALLECTSDQQRSLVNIIIIIMHCIGK